MTSRNVSIPTSEKYLPLPSRPRGQKVLVYPLEELLAEKMRSLLERGKSRDYYDVWRLLKEHSDKFDFKLVAAVLLKKLKHKGLTIRSAKDFLPEDDKGLKQYWEKDLQRQISLLPPLDDVLAELGDMLNKLVAPHLDFMADDT